MLAATALLELVGDIGEVILLEDLLVAFLGLFHVDIGRSLCRIEDLVALPLTTSGDGLGFLLEEMERLPLSFYMIDVSDGMYLRLKKGIWLSYCHHSSVTRTVSSWMPSCAASKRILFACAIMALTRSS